MSRSVNDDRGFLLELLRHYLCTSLVVSDSDIYVRGDSQLSVGPFSVRLEPAEDSNKYEITLKNKESGSAVMETVPFDVTSVKYPFQFNAEDAISLEFGQIFESKFGVFLNRFKPQQNQKEPTTNAKSVLRESTYSMLANPLTEETHRLPKVDLFPKDGPTTVKPKPLPDNLKPPGFDDEYEVKSQQQVDPLRLDTETNANRDLYPGGVSNLINPLGGNPTFSSGNSGIISGMHPTINDPLFKRHQDNDRNSNGLRLPGGGRVPGARYDDPLAGPDDDLDLAGMGLPSKMGFGGNGGFGGNNNNRGGFGGGYGGYGGPSGGFGGGYI